MRKPKFFSTAYPGSMSEREDGDYIEREDSETLAAALLQNIYAEQAKAEDWRDSAIKLEKDLAEMTKERDELLGRASMLAAAPTPPPPSPQVAQDEREAFEAWQKSLPHHTIENYTFKEGRFLAWQARAAMQQPKGAEWTDAEIMAAWQESALPAAYDQLRKFARAILAGKPATQETTK